MVRLFHLDHLSHELVGHSNERKKDEERWISYPAMRTGRLVFFSDILFHGSKPSSIRPRGFKGRSVASEGIEPHLSYSTLKPPSMLKLYVLGVGEITEAQRSAWHEGKEATVLRHSRSSVRHEVGRKHVFRVSCMQELPLLSNAFSLVSTEFVRSLPLPAPPYVKKTCTWNRKKRYPQVKHG
jgi:hypothetical protein